jgi:hypothetical protein
MKTTAAPMTAEDAQLFIAVTREALREVPPYAERFARERELRVFLANHDEATLRKLVGLPRSRQR